MARKELEEARTRLYQKSDRTRMILGVGGALFAVMLIIGILNGIDSINTTGRPSELPIRRAITWVTIAVMCFIGPYGFYASGKQKLVKQIERRLPDFLRDVAEAGRFGMILAEAIMVSSSGRYGKLTPEIKKMAAQISWGVPATEALRLFAIRVKTPMTERVVSIIVKSSDAGGDVADVLTMVSHATKETQLTEEERKISMSTYVAVIYISFLVFIVTIWIMNVTFLPKMVEAGTSLSSGGVGGASTVESPLAKDIVGVVNTIQLAFITAMLVHAVGDGILAGVLDNGKIATGLRHSFIMLFICVLSFMAM